MSTFRRRLIVQEQDKYVKFEDPEFERVCTAEWDKDGNGRLSKEEALQVVNIKNKMFKDNKIIKSADFDIFKNLTKMGGLMFRDSSVKRCKMNNITFFKDVHFSLDTTELFISLNSLKKTSRYRWDELYTGRKHLNMLGRIIIIRSDYECV